MKSTFRSLRVRNYRLFFFGQLVSVSGTWMQQVAQDWLVLHLSNSGFAVGVAVGLQFLPMLLFGMAGGIVADRFDKRRVLVVTQSVAGVLALAMGLLVATDVVALWMVFVLAFLLGCVTAVDNPTRQAFVTEMVGPEEVTNAIGLNSATFNAARIIGPAVAAVTIKTAGLSLAFFANAASYVAVISSLVRMRPAELFRTRKAAREPGQVRAGLRYVWTTPELKLTILLVTVVATFGLNLSVVLPLMAKFTFHGGAGTYGLLTSTMAVGALAGALFAARREAPSIGLLVWMAIAFGVSSVLTAIAPTLPLVLVGLLATGGSAISFMATANSTLQLRSDDRMRGRVMALYALVFLGSTPLGGPLTGWVSQIASPRLALALGGLITLAGGIAAWLYTHASPTRRTQPAQAKRMMEIPPAIRQ